MSEQSIQLGGDQSSRVTKRAKLNQQDEGEVGGMTAAATQPS